jgi:hypothetical protein
VIATLVQEIAAGNPDAVVIAGDLGEFSRDTAACLSLFRTVRCPVLVLAGNHDLFPDAYGSRRLWDEVLPRTEQDLGFCWLESNPFVRDGTAIIGSIAWYEYSAADPSIHEPPKTYAAEKRYFTPDHKINWPRTDPEFAGLVTRPFLHALDRLEADPEVRRIVVVTHVPILEEQIPRKPGDTTWGFANAYLGNLTMGREVLVRRKVTHVISGHTHVGNSAQVRTAGGGTIRAHVIGSDYRKPALLQIDLP